MTVVDSLTAPLLYGSIFSDLAEVPSEARQFSNLLTGSAKLESLAEGSAPAAYIAVPPGTLERRYALALALRALRPGAPLLALGPKDKGGSRIAKELRAFGCEVDEDSRSHFRLCRAARPPQLAGIEEAIAAGAPRFEPGLGLTTQPGVFSWDRPDPGSELLLKHLPAFSGYGADLGAGLGVLARAVLAGAKVQELHLVEIDRRAVECAEKNVPDSRARFHWADALSFRAPRPLDFVVTNPPFHDTGLENQELGREFLRRAAGLLRPGGVAWIVANRHLPYEEVLRASFTRSRPVAEERGFKIYEAVK